MNNQALQSRAEVGMWGCLACAQPWMVAGSGWAFVWCAAAIACWGAAKLAGRKAREPDYRFTTVVGRNGYQPRMQPRAAEPPPWRP